MKALKVGDIRKAVKKLKKLEMKPDASGNYVFKVPLDPKSTSTGCENWEVCARMLIHDLLELEIPEVKAILKHYSIDYTQWGTYTMALPRFNVVNKK